MEKWQLQCQNYYTGIAYSDAKKKKKKKEAGTGEAANQNCYIHPKKCKKPRSFADLFTGGFIDFKINTDVE